MGAIFIPRSFNNEAYTERNLNNVIEFILVNKIPLKCLLKVQDHEMGILLPKYGILKSLCSIYLKQRNEEKNTDFNLLFQPISVTYERVYENDAF